MHGVAQPHDLVDHATMQTLAMSFQFAFSGGLAPPGSQIAPAVFPGQPLLASLLGTTLLIVVVRIGHPPFSIQAALKAAQLSGVRGEFRTQQFQPGFCLACSSCY